MSRLLGAMRPTVGFLATEAILAILFSSPTPALAVDGTHPNGAVICEGGAPYYGSGAFYGVTSTGGANNLGVVYKIATDVSHTETILHAFTGADGSNPTGMLAGPPNVAGVSTLYGVTSNGGAHSDGTIYKISTSGTFTTLYSFSGVDGIHPTSVIWDGADALYGTCSAGGTASSGTIFRFSLSTSTLTVLRSLSSADGTNPSSNLFLDGTTLYGAAPNGGSGYGTVFSIGTGGTAFTVLHSFNSTAGANPACRLIKQVGTTTTLLGTTKSGGTNNTGTIFSINENGSGFTQLATFGAGGASNLTGVNPVDGFSTYTTGSGGGTTYWGLTSGGGTGNGGVLYAFTIANGIQGMVYFTSNTTNSFYAMGYSPVGPPAIFPTIVGGPLFYMVSNYYGGTSNNNNGVLFAWVGNQPDMYHTFGL